MGYWLLLKLKNMECSIEVIIHQESKNVNSKIGLK